MDWLPSGKEANFRRKLVSPPVSALFTKVSSKYFFSMTHFEAFKSRFFLVPKINARSDFFLSLISADTYCVGRTHARSGSTTREVEIVRIPECQDMFFSLPNDTLTQECTILQKCVAAWSASRAGISAVLCTWSALPVSTFWSPRCCYCLWSQLFLSPSREVFSIPRTSAYQDVIRALRLIYWDELRRQIGLGVCGFWMTLLTVVMLGTCSWYSYFFLN